MGFFVASCTIVALFAFAPRAFGQCASCSAGSVSCTNQLISNGAAAPGGRVFLDGSVPSCGAAATCGTPATGTFKFLKYTFTNNTGGASPDCFTVTFSNFGTCVSSDALVSAAYLGTYDPANPCTNLLADMGLSTQTNTTYSFNVANGATVAVIVWNRVSGTFCPNTFTISISPCPLSGPTAADGSISGMITDSNGAAVVGATIGLSGSQSRKTITDARGNYYFDNVETAGFYTVTPSRANYSFSPANRSLTLLGNQTDAAFTGSANGDNANPLDTPEYFVRQQYVDILGREPDEGGFNYWSNEINKCGSDAACTDRRRREVAASFFIEQEFQETGSFVYGLYKASFGARPTFAQYQLDRKRVIGGPTLSSSRQALADDFVARADFKQLYPDSMTSQEFVDKLYDTAGLPFSLDRILAVNRMQNGATRSEILEGVIANTEFARAEYNSAFVLTEYFGFLRRDPEAQGYDFWLNVLDHADAGNYGGMVCSFITSTEYQKRFSSVVTHNNGECGQ